MTDQDDLPARDVISFGPFTLIPAQRLLEKAGHPLNLGARAMQILLVLTEQPGQMVGKKALMARVWPDVTVDEGSLRFQVAALRKALGERQSSARYVTTNPGRGYCFVAPVSRTHATDAPSAALGLDQAHELPVLLARIVGRDETVRAVSTQLLAKRFVTIAGPGGIGKTTVAVAVGHELHDAFAGAVRFVDLGPVTNPLLVPSALAATLGLLVQSADSVPGLVAFLRGKRMLVILDSCEHVIETASALAETIFRQAPDVHILTTSRELLRVDGEHVHRLAPLESPPDEAGMTAKAALAFPAVQLFVERVAAAGDWFELSDADAPSVGEICRKLDGMALAIELAAGRVGTFGVKETARRLDSQFRLMWPGRRTALPRHQTLGATLDWSYDLLPNLERLILRRLSVFVGVFTLEAALSVAAGNGVDESQVLDATASLVAKSLVTADTCGPPTRYRLLDMTRAYVFEKLAESGEVDEVARRHAHYFYTFLDRSNTVTPDVSRAKAFG